MWDTEGPKIRIIILSIRNIPPVHLVAPKLVVASAAIAAQSQCEGVDRAVADGKAVLGNGSGAVKGKVRRAGIILAGAVRNPAPGGIVELTCSRIEGEDGAAVVEIAIRILFRTGCVARMKLFSYRGAIWYPFVVARSNVKGRVRSGDGGCSRRYGRNTADGADGG